jgi:hypothetical protein
LKTLRPLLIILLLLTILSADAIAACQPAWRTTTNTLTVDCQETRTL